MEINKPPETPFFMKKTEIDENLMQLSFEETNDVTHPKSYLEKHTLKPKCEPDLKIDRYVLTTRDCSKKVQFYMQVQPSKITYLTAQNFTFGLKRVPARTLHLVKNFAHSTSVFLFHCMEEKSHRYFALAESFKALVNKTWILQDFHLKIVRPSEIVSLPPNAVYFLFVTSHSRFAMECLQQGSYPSLPDALASTSPTTRELVTSPTVSDVASPSAWNLTYSNRCEDVASPITRDVVASPITLDVVRSPMARDVSASPATSDGVASPSTSLMQNKQREKYKFLEETNANLLNKVGKMDKEINDLREKTERQEDEIEILRNKNKSLDSELATVKQKLRIYENDYIDRQLKRKRSSVPDSSQ